ncbi:MAG: hypothetical protein CMN31_16800 [Sandaracinus sp.]|nr:hypothetical protein [Sandaracinus sp.]
MLGGARRKGDARGASPGGREGCGAARLGAMMEAARWRGGRRWRRGSGNWAESGRVGGASGSRGAAAGVRRADAAGLGGGDGGGAAARGEAAATGVGELGRLEARGRRVRFAMPGAFAGSQRADAAAWLGAASEAARGEALALGPGRAATGWALRPQTG